jgi:hypothetical protein
VRKTLSWPQALTRLEHRWEQQAAQVAVEPAVGVSLQVVFWTHPRPDAQQQQVAEKLAEELKSAPRGASLKNCF